MGSGERIFLVVMRGTSPASARTILVTDNEDVTGATVALIQEQLNPGESFEQAVAGSLGPELVRDPAGYGGHYAPDEHDSERRAELVRFHSEGPEQAVVSTQFPPLLDTAFRLVESAPPDEPPESPSRRRWELRLHQASASSYGNLRSSGSSTHPDVLAQFIRAFIESSQATDGEREILRALLPEIAEAAALEKADETAWRAWDAARRERDAAESEVKSQELWIADSRRQAAGARDRVDAANTLQPRPSAQRMAELEAEAAEAEAAEAEAEKRLEAAKVGAVKASVREREARKAYDAQLERTEVESAE